MIMELELIAFDIFDMKHLMTNSFTKQFVPYAKYFHNSLFVDIRHRNVFSIKVVM